MTYSTRKQKFPGSTVITAEFLAVATPEQAALFAATMAGEPVEGCATGWVSNDDDARYGAWRLIVGRDTVVLYFYRGTPGTVQVAC